MQLIVNKASLFTYDCDINVLKNYLEVYDIKAMCSLTMHLVPTGLLSDHADNRNGELVASYETLTLGMALVKEPSFGSMRMARILSELDITNILFTNIFFKKILEDIYPFCGGK